MRIVYVIVAVWFVNNVVTLIRGSAGWIDQSIDWVLLLAFVGLVLREHRRDRRRDE
jgi:hypothetical protein